MLNADPVDPGRQRIWESAIVYSGKCVASDDHKRPSNTSELKQALSALRAAFIMMADAPETISLVLPGENLSSILKCVPMIADAAIVKFAITHDHQGVQSGNSLKALQSIARTLNTHGKKVTAEALEEVVQRCVTLEDFGGYGMDIEATLHPQQEADVTFLCSAYLEAVKSAARAQSKPAPLNFRPAGRPGMTMAEKIFAMHDVSRKGYVRPGDIIQVDVDWILASELSWAVSLEYEYVVTSHADVLR